MPRLQRFNIKAMLANPDLRRKLIVEGTRATQAREGVEVSTKEAENSYYVVTETERAAFLNLVQFRTESGENDGRHSELVRAINNVVTSSRSDTYLRDFLTIESAPLAYDRLALVGFMFRNFPPIEPKYARVRQGKATAGDLRWLRAHWEITASTWVPFSKGGEFSRFYSDVFLRIDWAPEHRNELKASGNGLPSEDLYFRPGLTWPLRTQRGFNLRKLPAGCVFGHRGSAIMPESEELSDYLLGVLNTTLAEFALRCFSSFGTWEVGAIRKIPVPPGDLGSREQVAHLANYLHDAKAIWDTGNEICTRFDFPWLMQSKITDGAATVAAALNAVLAKEASLDVELKFSYAELNESVYKLYGVNEVLRSKIEAAIGQRPPEIVWPQMEGKSTEQKRLEHVNRLLGYLVKRIIEADSDGLVCLQAVANELPLLDRLRAELHLSFPQQDPSALETEVVNELKKKVKGYRRVETLNEWLNDAFFEIHANLYQQRPLLWHLASSQTRSVPAFSVVVHAHKFDGDALAKLRSVHIRDRLTTLRREAGQARQDNREEDRLELLAAIEEVEAFDAKLKLLQEGAHTGPEGGDRDYRILTPWKSESERPQGWNPDLDDGIKVNIAPLARTGLLRIKGRFGEKDVED